VWGKRRRERRRERRGETKGRARWETKRERTGTRRVGGMEEEGERTTNKKGVCSVRRDR
jgi:hypothetical protein